MRIAWLDREAAIAEMREYAERLIARDDRVMAVGLFGSLARREALPSSDADLLIALKTHPEGRWFDRIPEFAAAFQGTSLPVEPFPYLVEELRALLSHPGFLRTGLGELVPMGGDGRLWQELRDALVRGAGANPLSPVTGGET